MTKGRVRVALVLALALLSGGCARLFDHYDVGPDGLARADARIRTLLGSARDSSALAGLLDRRDALPSDPLLARLYAGIILYHAGEFGRSAAVFDTATLLIDDRETKSAARAALSVLSTDRVLRYQATDAERLLLHYYAALAWLRTGSPDDAAVEARRLTLLLEQHTPDDGATRALHGALRHAAAALFACAGEWADADVAYRNAHALAHDSTGDVRLTRTPADSSDVFLFVDRGFVGHRAEQAVALWLGGDEIGRLRDGDDDARAGTAHGIAARILGAAAADPHGVAPLLQVPAERTAPNGASPGRDAPHPVAGDAGGFVTTNGTRPRATRDDEDADDDDGLPYLLRIAWPVFRDDAPVLGDSRVLAGDAAHAPIGRASVSAAVAADFAHGRAFLVARTVARAAAKAVITRAVADELREKDETAADVFAALGNLANVVTEQADTRSWTLLPGRIEITRVRVPAGAHAFTVEAHGRRVVVPVDAPAGRAVVRHVVLR